MVNTDVVSPGFISTEGGVKAPTASSPGTVEMPAKADSQWSLPPLMGRIMERLKKVISQYSFHTPLRVAHVCVLRVLWGHM